jgi:hypothetical protein
VGDAAHELRANAVSDGKQEHQEEDRLHLARDGNVHLADEHAGQQRARHRAKAEAAELDGPDPIAKA